MQSNPSIISDTGGAPQHTPTPWVYEYRAGNVSNNPPWGIVGFWGANNQLICAKDVDGEQDFFISLEADRDFIVRACNNHYELINALQDLLADRDAATGGKPTGWDGNETVRRVTQARAALAKATGQ